jgi:hypothetical protein
MLKASKRRYAVEACDNLGTVDGLRRDRTWVVVDRQTIRQERAIVVAEFDRRTDARDECERLNSWEVA